LPWTSNRFQTIFCEFEVALVALVVRLDLDGLLEAVHGLLVLLHARVRETHSAVGFAVAEIKEIFFITLFVETLNLPSILALKILKIQVKARYTASILELKI
jgi:hypothetical protein